MNLLSSSDTIVAQATPSGRGGIGIIRLSGSDALKIGKLLTALEFLPPRQALYTNFLDYHGKIIDFGLIIFFQAPNSFTGEDVIEFQGHGSPIVLDNLIQSSVALGARIAKPGEFSERAFLNSKIDLTQAEAIADLINANSDKAARLALRSLQGKFAEYIHQLNNDLIELRVFIEAAIDFSTEELEFLPFGNINLKLQELLIKINSLRQQTTQGILIKEGLKIVLAGFPNAGKSTLLNQLAGQNIAITTPIAGTTRDTLRQEILIDDLPLHLIDTAGLRESTDPVEQEGIKRAWQEIKNADCILLLIDLTSNNSQEIFSLTNEIKNLSTQNIPIINIFNKIDLTMQRAKIEKNNIYISAKDGNGIELLKNKIKEIGGYQPQEGQFLARRRHLTALDEAKQFLVNAAEQLALNFTLEFVADDLRLAQRALEEITGEFTSDDLLGKIFANFCIGK